MKRFEKLPKINNGKISKVFLLTHTDMDGSGPAIILKNLLGEDNVTVKHCPNNTMSKDILAVVLDDKLMEQYDNVFICDISCTEEDARLIDDSPNKNKVVLLDHHVTAMDLNQYDWALVCPDMIRGSYRESYYPAGTVGHSSGTSLMYDYLKYCNLIEDDNEFLKTLVHTIAIYDTWDWVYVFNSTEEAKKLSSLFYIYGIGYFEKRYIEKCKNSNALIIDGIDEMFLSIEDKKRTEYCDKKKESFQYSVVKIAEREYEMVYCSAEQYLPDVFALMQTEYPQADVYCINCLYSISLRTRKEGVDVSQIAKLFGGGGHPQAAGFPVKKDLENAYILSHFLN